MSSPKKGPPKHGTASNKDASPNLPKGTTSKFGHAGKRTVHHSAAAATVRVSDGQSVRWTVDVGGAVPSFKFVCEHRTLYQPDDPPRSHYHWSAIDFNAHAPDVHVLDLRFTGATSYRYRAELLNAQGAVVETLKDIEYESRDSRDFYLEPIRLRIEPPVPA